MEAARFIDVAVTDVTKGFLRTARGWFSGFERHEPELKRVMGAQEWTDRQRDREAMIAAIEGGLLRRLIVTGTAPP